MQPGCSVLLNAHFCRGKLDLLVPAEAESWLQNVTCVFCLCSQMYKHSNNKTMSSGAIAAMLSTILYGRRFFPYYVYNIIGGLDEEGEHADDI